MNQATEIDVNSHYLGVTWAYHNTFLERRSNKNLCKLFCLLYGQHKSHIPGSVQVTDPLLTFDMRSSSHWADNENKFQSKSVALHCMFNYWVSRYLLFLHVQFISSCITYKLFIYIFSTLQLRQTNFAPPLNSNRFFDTTNLTSYCAKKVQRHQYDAGRLQRSSVPIGTLTI